MINVLSNAANKIIDEAHGDSQKLAVAMDIVAREVQLDPRNTRARFLLGWAAQQRGLIDQALSAYNAAFPELKSVTWAARVNAGDLSQLKGNLQGAEDDFMECIRIAPEQDLGWDKLIRVLKKQGKNDEAKQYFDSLKEVAPKSPLIPKLVSEFHF